MKDSYATLESERAQTIHWVVFVLSPNFTVVRTIDYRHVGTLACSCDGTEIFQNPLKLSPRDLSPPVRVSDSCNSTVKN